MTRFSVCIQYLSHIRYEHIAMRGVEHAAMIGTYRCDHHGYAAAPVQSGSREGEVVCDSLNQSSGTRRSMRYSCETTKCEISTDLLQT